MNNHEDLIDVLSCLLLCAVAGLLGMYAVMRAQQHDWTMLWLDLTFLFFILRGAFR